MYIIHEYVFARLANNIIMLPMNNDKTLTIKSNLKTDGV